MKPLTRFKAEITAGKNSNMKYTSANYNVKLAKQIHKIGYTNFIVIPFMLLGPNTIQRKRIEKLFIGITQPNMNSKLFGNHFKIPTLNRRCRPLKNGEKQNGTQLFALV